MERRRTARREPVPDEPLSRVRLRTGREVVVVNVSNSGLLVEGAARLLPGTHVDVHVVTRDGRVLVRSRVTRAYVCALEADAVRDRGALAFEWTVDTTITEHHTSADVPAPHPTALASRVAQEAPEPWSAGSVDA